MIKHTGLAPFLTEVLRVLFTVRTFSRRLCVALALVAVWLTAQAGPVTQIAPVATYARNSATVSYPDSGLKALLNQRTYTSNSTGVAVSDSVLLTIGGEVITAAASRVVPAAGVSGLAVGAALAGGFVAGTALYEYMTDNGVAYVTSSGTFTRTPPQNTGAPGSGVWTVNQNTGVSGYGTPLAACNAKFGSTAMYTKNVNATSAECWWTNTDSIAGAVWKTGTCPIGSPDASGKCPYQGVPVPIAASEVPGYLTKPAPNPAGVVKQAVEAGVKPQAGSTSLTGPSISQHPKVVTSTGPTGTSTTTTTNNYQYNGDKVTYTTTNVTNITNNAGDIISSTTTTDSAPEDERSQCDMNPESIGCAEMDTPEGEIPKDTKTLTFQEENLFGAGACPADGFASLSTIGGQTMKVVDWATMCNFALPMRGLVLALASVSAFFILMPGTSDPS